MFLDTIEKLKCCVVVGYDKFVATTYCRAR